ASTDFPVTPGVIQSKLLTYSNGSSTFPCTNAFITKLKPDGSGLAYSTFLGGSTNGGGVSEDYAQGITVDSEGNAVIVGSTTGIDFPVTAGAFETQNLSWLYSLNDSSFVTRINSTATGLLYSTYLSGTGNQSPYYYESATAAAL